MNSASLSSANTSPLDDPGFSHSSSSPQSPPVGSSSMTLAPSSRSNVAVQEVDADDNNNNNNNSTTTTTTLDEQQQQVEEARQRGNAEFHAGHYEAAAAWYTSGVEHLLTAWTSWTTAHDDNRADRRDGVSSSGSITTTTTTPPPDSPSSSDPAVWIRPQMTTLLCNRATAYLPMQRYQEAAHDAQQAWITWSQHTHIKAAYRWAQALLALQDYTQARQVLQQARQQQISSSETSEAVASATASAQPPTLDQQRGLLEQQQQQQQRQALDQLWQQVLQAAYTKKEPSSTTAERSIRFVQRPVSIKEFDKGAELGVGNFSQVFIVTYPSKKNQEAQACGGPPQERFALKMIDKKQAADLAKRQHPNVYNEIHMERRVLLERLPPHPHVIRLYHAFQDYHALYYLMDLHIEWGDLWSELRFTYRSNNNNNNNNTAPASESATRGPAFMVGCHPSQAVVWMYQLVDAVEHMHRHGIVHRDLKPENILLNARGEVVVIDFGTAKDLIQTDLNGPEFVGTPDFMSPEAVQGTGDDDDLPDDDPEDPLHPGRSLPKKERPVGAVHSADLWAVGAILFTLLTGRTPFWCPSPYLAFLKIKRAQLLRPEGLVDDQAWDLIVQLMRRNPAERLGADAFALKIMSASSVEPLPAATSTAESAVEGSSTSTTTTDPPGSAHPPPQRIMEQTRPDGYDVIRRHPYFASILADPTCVDRTPVPTLRDLCIRALAELVRQDAMDVDLCDQHPPGDQSGHDMMRLSPEDRARVMHVLDRSKLLRDPRVYARFFTDPVSGRLDKVRSGPHDYVGLTQMNDDQGKPPHAMMNDPYAKPVAMDHTVQIVHLTNPLFLVGHWYDQTTEGAVNEETRKAWRKQLKKCISTINKSRPKLVVVTGYLDASTRKLLARISESIPVVAHNGSEYFTFWMMGVQCIALKASDCSQEESSQVSWLREHLEQCRMSKYPLFVFVDCDPRRLPHRLLKRLARGRVLLLCGLSDKADEGTFATRVTYRGNEMVDDMSLRSTESEEDEKDSLTMKVVGANENGLRWIRVEPEPDHWNEEFRPIKADSS